MTGALQLKIAQSELSFCNGLRFVRLCASSVMACPRKKSRCVAGVTCCSVRLRGLFSKLVTKVVIGVSRADRSANGTAGIGQNHEFENLPSRPHTLTVRPHNTPDHAGCGR